MKILGIETSCDETAVSIIQADKGGISVLSSAISSQIKLHAKWGGVVPNLAAREHLQNILPVLESALHEAKTSPEEISLIAVTQGPGLIPALLVGADAAKTLSYVWEKPLLGIHHIEGHIYANFIWDKVSVISKSQFPISKQISKSKFQNLKIPFPILCLVVSGGHTQLVLMKKHLDYEIIGETLDDAVGEAFDKTARILGLGYPGGPAIAAAAAEFSISIPSTRDQFPNELNAPAGKQNSELKISFPRPMINSKNFNFSFSGLKTAVLYLVKKIPPSRLPALKNQICYEFQQAAIEVLISKTIKAAQKYNPQTILLAGGVSANQELRKQLGIKIKKELPGTTYRVPDIKHSIDNAAMIAAAGYFRWNALNESARKKTLRNWAVLRADAGLKLE